MTSLDWPYIPMSAISTAPIVYGIVQPGQHVMDGIPFVQTRDIGRPLVVGSLDRTSSKIAAAYRRSSLKAGDLLLSLRGDIGASTIVPPALEGANISRGVARVRPTDRHDPHFIHYALQAPRVRRSISAASRGSTLREISIGSLRDVCVPVPPLPQQRKIAEILRIWDDAIDKTLELRRLADGRRVELAERMLVPSHGVRWRLSELTRSIKTRNSEGFLGRESVMGVSNRSGLVPMREQTIAADISRYQVLPPRAFAYNPMRINVGSIAMSRLESHVLVSPDYVLFQCDERELRPEYLDHVLRTRWWLHHVNAGASGSVRTRTYYDDLAAISIAAPPIAEQDNVSRALDGLEKEIQLLQRKAELLRTQKSGLMQKLLTGQVRVNVAADIEPGGHNDD